MDNNLNYLYHYTSIETLALILKNKTIRFNSLKGVDDLAEAKDDILYDTAKNVFVTCWTKEKKENIALWNMYTPDMKGVRIKMRHMPFEVINSTLSINDPWLKKKYKSLIKQKSEQCIISQAIKTDVEIKEFMKYKKINNKQDFEDNYSKIYSMHLPIKHITDFNISYSDDKSPPPSPYSFEYFDYIKKEIQTLGEQKDKVWEFQNEYRYMLKEEYFSNEKNLKYHDIVLAEDIFNNFEVLLGPKTNDSHKIIVESLLSKYCTNHIVKSSNLSIGGTK